MQPFDELIQRKEPTISTHHIKVHKFIGHTLRFLKMDRDHEFSQCLLPFHRDGICYFKIGCNWSSGSRGEDKNVQRLMIDERCTTNDDGQKQIHVCHISDLDDLHNLALNSLNSISNNVDKKS